jgi:hypothetical protein
MDKLHLGTTTILKGWNHSAQRGEERLPRQSFPTKAGATWFPLPKIHYSEVTAPGRDDELQQ